MQIKLKSSMEMLQAHARSIPAHAGYTMDQFKWREILNKIGGMTLEVKTDHIFEDQFNTAPIPGVSEIGIRVMNSMVEEIIDDVRPLALKCDYCGHTVHGAADDKIGSRCPKCEKAENGEWGYLGVDYKGKGWIKRLKIKPL